MKNNIRIGFLALSLIFAALWVYAFDNEGPQTANATAEAVGVTVFSSDPDTLTTSSSLDTVTFTFANFYGRNNYALQVSADSLSGSTGATCQLEINADLAGNDWATLETVTVNGVSTRAYETGEILRGTLRCRCYAPSSTQSTAVRADLVVSNQSL